MPWKRKDEAGYFAVLIPGRRIPSYLFRVTKGEETEEFADPYAFAGQITEEEEKAFCAGVYYHAYDKLGAHPATIRGTQGVSFAVWAPNAVSVSVAGDLINGTEDGILCTECLCPAFLSCLCREPRQEIFINMKLKVKGGEIKFKTDPYGASIEQPPASASVVADVSGFQWEDDSWVKNRKKYADRKQPLSIYETSMDQWKDGAELRNMPEKLGYTHVELHPVMAYLNDEAGPYSTYGYYALDRRLGTPEDFQKFMNELHKAEIGVILDWTPAAFPREEGGLELFDGTPLYEEPDPSMAIHPMGELCFTTMKVRW